MIPFSASATAFCTSVVKFSASSGVPSWYTSPSAGVMSYVFACPSTGVIVTLFGNWLDLSTKPIVCLLSQMVAGSGVALSGVPLVFFIIHHDYLLSVYHFTNLFYISNLFGDDGAVHRRYADNCHAPHGRQPVCRSGDGVPILCRQVAICRPGFPKGAGSAAG